MSQHDVVTNYMNKISKEDAAKISQVAARACELFWKKGRVNIDQIETEMDLSAVHVNLPLRLDDMLQPEGEHDLIHDVSGIHRHLDRDTGELGGCFLPRFAR